MTPHDVLARRRELVLMSCDMQRATLTARLASVQRHRGLAWAAAILSATRLAFLQRHRGLAWAAASVAAARLARRFL